MLLSFITDSQYITYNLPAWLEGDYFVTDPDDGQELFEIEGTGTEWKITELDDNKILDSDLRVLSDNLLFKIRYGSQGKQGYLYAENNNERYAKFARCPMPDNIVLTVGSDSNCDIVLKNKLISPTHCKIECKQRVWYITDCRSKIGTYLNGVKVSSSAVVSGDIVSILNQKFTFLPGLISFNAQSVDLKAINNKLHSFKVSPVPEDKIIGKLTKTEFFHRSPRFTNDIVDEDINVVAPPSQQNAGDNGGLLMYGPAVVSSLAMLLGGMANPITGIGMLAGSLIFPGIRSHKMKTKNAADEKTRQEQYTKYLESLDKNLDELNERQTEQLLKNNISAKAEIQKIMKDCKTLWNRRPEHNDFLDIRLGTGDIPVHANITFPQEVMDFSGKEDNLKEKLDEIKNKPRLLHDVPIMLQLAQYYSIGISGNPKYTKPFLAQLMLQLSMHIGYDELKICVIGKLPQGLERLVWIPHTWDNQKNAHYVAENKDELGRILPVYDAILREHRSDNYSPKSSSSTVVFLITDQVLANSGMVSRLLFDKNYSNVHVISIAEHSRDLPRRIDMAIGLAKGMGRLVWQDEKVKNTMDFNFDADIMPDFDKVISLMANTFLDLNEEMTVIPDMVPFLDMFNVNNVTRLNVLSKWKNADPIHSLAAPIGISEDGNMCYLNLHEKSDGPHGLVAGTTGSGKSEMLMNYILSMAVCFSPEELSFVLIDYKGGGMAQAFANLPHTAGIITNLDGNEINRSLLSIKSELERRQRIFSKAQEEAGVRNIDIYKYQKFYRDGKVKVPLSHLVIITDEFAELKTQEPEFLEQLIRAARIGRSLGVHLILATQKPAGVVDDQIWSNSNFHICLRVQDARDSQDVLKCEDAAHLTKSGSLYKQVGYGDVLIKAQSAYTGADYSPDSVNIPSCGIDVLDNMGSVIRHEELNLSKKAASAQLEAVTDYIINISKRAGLAADKLWLPALEETIRRKDLREKYSVTDEPWVLNPVLGELDDPSNQKRDLVRMDLYSGKNVIICGATGSGKIMSISAVLEDLMLTHTADELNIYIIDAADDGLAIYTKAPQIGDVIGSTEDEKIKRLVLKLEKEIAVRKKILGGSVMGESLAERMKKANVPNILVIIHHIIVFQALAEEYEDRFKAIMMEGPRYGIVFMATQERASGLHFQLSQLFPQNYVLQLDSDDDYIMLIGRTNGIKPSAVTGRGLVKDENIYEYQTATTDFTPVELCDKLASEWKGEKADAIRVLPNTIPVEDMFTYLDKTKPWSMPIGLDVNTIRPVSYDFGDRVINVLLGQDDYIKNTTAGIAELAGMNGIDVTYLDEDDSEEIIDDLFDYCKEFKKSKDAGTEMPETAPRLIIIPDLNKLKGSIDDDHWDTLTTMLAKSNSMWSFRFLISDYPDALGKFQYNDWFTASVSKGDGIYVGDGFAGQYVFQTDKYISESIEYPLGYCLKNKKAVKIKLIQSSNEEVM